jgi:hypothetical protein
MIVKWSKLTNGTTTNVRLILGTLTYFVGTLTYFLDTLTYFRYLDVFWGYLDVFEVPWRILRVPWRIFGTLTYFRYHWHFLGTTGTHFMVPLAELHSMMIDTIVSKYMYYRYRRVAYQSIRLEELITEMCFVWLCDISCANCPPQSNPKPVIKVQ